jgi:hypothetical protein
MFQGSSASSTSTTPSPAIKPHQQASAALLKKAANTIKNKKRQIMKVTPPGGPVRKNSGGIKMAQTIQVKKVPSNASKDNEVQVIGTSSSSGIASKQKIGAGTTLAGGATISPAISVTATSKPKPKKPLSSPNVSLTKKTMTVKEQVRLQYLLRHLNSRVFS